ncbi:MAG TPA: monooxygenase [Kineosporiaceae bacterium]
MSRGPDPAAPPLVSLTLWGVAGRQVPAALARMALDRRHLRATPGLRFGKLLGTGAGRTFGPRDADPHRWGVLATWSDPDALAAFEAGPTARAWGRISTERLTVTMVPLASRGQWSRRRPFGDPAPRPVQGPVAAITRARLRWRRTPTFWSAVPAVAADLHTAPGLRLAIGIGEAPIGLQGTFSLWDDAARLVTFAHRREPHAAVVARTASEKWYAEELFARFQVLAVEGTIHGRDPLEPHDAPRSPGVVGRAATQPEP